MSSDGAVMITVAVAVLLLYVTADQLRPHQRHETDDMTDYELDASCGQELT